MNPNTLRIRTVIGTLADTQERIENLQHQISDAQNSLDCLLAACLLLQRQ